MKGAKIPPTKVRKFGLWRGPIPGSHEPGFQEEVIREIDASGAVRLAAQSGLDLEFYAFRMGECNILLGREPAGGGPLRWHLTISTPHRHPTWDEIKVARYRILGPDVAMAMHLPPADHYVNVPQQDHVFQLWELLDGEASDSWRQR